MILNLTNEVLQILNNLNNTFEILIIDSKSVVSKTLRFICYAHFYKSEHFDRTIYGKNVHEIYIHTNHHIYTLQTLYE